MNSKSNDTGIVSINLPFKVIPPCSWKFLTYLSYIAFDLTLINGKSYNQYAFVDVDNHKIILQSLTISSKVDDNVFNISKKFLALNPDIIEKSILPKALKFTLLEETKIKSY